MGGCYQEEETLTAYKVMKSFLGCHKLDLFIKQCQAQLREITGTKIDWAVMHLWSLQSLAKSRKLFKLHDNFEIQGCDYR